MQTQAEELYHMYKNYAEKLNQELQSLRRFRHDLKKQYFLERMYLETGRYDLLKKAYERISVQPFMEGGYSGNVLIDAWLGSVRNEAERQNVEFVSRIQVPVDLKIEDTHMVRLLGNILDNALEGTEGPDHFKERSDKKWIRLYIRYDRGNLYIRCENSCLQKPCAGFSTAKKQKQDHGMGLAIIREIAALYDGTVEVEYREHVFCIQVLLSQVEKEV